MCSTLTGYPQIRSQGKKNKELGALVKDQRESMCTINSELHRVSLLNSDLNKQVLGRLHVTMMSVMFKFRILILIVDRKFALSSC